MPTAEKQLKDNPQYYQCAHCDSDLNGKKYILREDEPTCTDCYKEKFAERCESCGKAIGPDYKDLAYKGRHWHEECFKCWGCKTLLSSQQFVGKDDGLYCPDCYDKSFAQKCDLCRQTFKHGMQKFEYNNRKYHHQCFLCVICNKPIGNNSFVPRDDDLICMPCYNENFAQKCAKCSDVLIQGGVTFRDGAYHKECFLCTSCNCELMHLKFATKDEKPYCPDCYVKIYAKICEKCNQYIAGLGVAVKFISFDKRQWHNDCFVCTVCDKNLTGQGFLVANNDVMCPDCGKKM